MAANQNQRNFFLALILSLGVLLLWSYIFPPPKPDESANNSNAQQVAANDAPQNANSQTQNAPAATAAQQQSPPTQIQNQTPDSVQNRIISIKTPLYEAKFDSRGAVVTSWILKKNVTSEGEKPLFSASNTKDNPQPLELISEKAREMREVPLKIVTGDANFDAVLNDRNYQITGVEADAVELSGNDSRKIEFVLRDEANNIEAVKTLTLYANSYLSDLQTKITRGGQAIENARLQIGASVGDQGIKHHTYYAIEPEAVANVKGSTERHPSASFVDKNNGQMAVGGETSWAGVGDTYFAMAAIPQQPASGVEFKTAKYEVQLAEPYTSGIWGLITGAKIDKETRHLTSALLPIPVDGNSITKLYVGTKDHLLMTETSKTLTQSINRTVDLESFINYYGWLSPVVRPLAIPIAWTLSKLSGITQNYGLAILLFTILFFSLLFPMRWYQSKSFKKAQKNAPKMKALQDKLKDFQAKKIPADDPRMRELQMEQLKMTKDAVPIGGCLPMLIQLPLLFALYASITISLDFRQASFLWMPDLSGGDPFHLLEFIFAGSMMLSMLYTPTAAAITPEQAMQQKMMTYFMPLMMLWVMWGAPAGLLVYWVTSNVVGFFQQLFINRLNKTGDEPPTGTTSLDRPLTKKERMKTSLSTP